MTNKNKRTTTKQRKNNEPPEKSQQQQQQPELKKEAPKSFTTAQLGALLCVSVGVAKLMEFSTALKQGNEDPTSCLSYLQDEDVCKHPEFVSLIRVKFYSSLNLTAIFVALAFLLWNTEHMFLKFMTCIGALPLTATGAVAAFLCARIINTGRLYHMIIVSGALMLACKPTTQLHFPFINEKLWTVRNFQSLCLITLTILSLADVARVLKGGMSGEDAQGIQNAVVVLDSPLPDAAKGIVYFWIVDKLCMALLYAFTLVHLPVHGQRTFLFAILLLKSVEYYYQLPNTNFIDSSTIEHSTMVSAIFAGLSWLVF